MKILLDMNIPLKYNMLLRERGIGAFKWSDVGAPNAPDTEIMSFARDNDCIVMTCDIDFCTILSVTHELKPSIVQIRGSVLQAEKTVGLLVPMLAKYSDELNNGAILSLDSKGARLRKLPV
jgi:predicted nuclease of predicted toxin-antitoxin system